MLGWCTAASSIPGRDCITDPPIIDGVFYDPAVNNNLVSQNKVSGNGGSPPGDGMGGPGPLDFLAADLTYFEFEGSSGNCFKKNKPAGFTPSSRPSRTGSCPPTGARGPSKLNSNTEGRSSLDDAASGPDSPSLVRYRLRPASPPAAWGRASHEHRSRSPSPSPVRGSQCRFHPVAETIETHGCSIVLRRVEGPEARSSSSRASLPPRPRMRASRRSGLSRDPRRPRRRGRELRVGRKRDALSAESAGRPRAGEGGAPAGSRRRARHRLTDPPRPRSSSPR